MTRVLERPSASALIGLCALWLSGQVPAQSYEPVRLARARHLEWVGAVDDPRGARVVLQTGFEISLFEAIDGEPKVVRSSTLPRDTFVWDLVTPTGKPTRVVAIGEKEVYALVPGKAGEETVSLGASGDLFRGRLTAAPVRAELTALDGADGFLCALPGLAETRVRRIDGDLKPGATLTVDAPASNEQSLGWGIGYKVRSRLTVPWLTFAQVDVRAGADLLVRRGGAFDAATREADGFGALRPWGRTPDAETFEIIDFAWFVKPLAEDLDGDDRTDVVLADPGGGTLLVYLGRGRDREDRSQPDQVIQVDGWIFWRWLVDVDGDGRRDLVLLEVPKIGLLGQLRVFSTSVLSTRLTVRLQSAEGTFVEAPHVVRDVDLPISIGITRSARTIRFRAPLFPLPAAGGGFRFLGPGDDGVVVRSRDRDGDWTEAATGLAIEEEGGWFDSPFVAPRHDVTGDGVVDPVLLVRRASGRDSAILLRSK